TSASSSSPFLRVSGVVALAAPEAPEGFLRRRRLRDADSDAVRSSSSSAASGLGRRAAGGRSGERSAGGRSAAGPERPDRPPLGRPPPAAGGRFGSGLAWPAPFPPDEPEGAPPLLVAASRA